MQFHDQSLPITSLARQTAQKFASQQASPAKAEQVLLNTLAVWVVHDYLYMMGVPSDLEAGDSWNPVVRACVDIADLEVSGVGRLECRPIRPHETHCTIPPEVWGDRIGYLVIEIDRDYRRATLLGFMLSATQPSLYRDKIQPLSALLIYLSEFKVEASPVAYPEDSSKEQNYLEQWLQGFFKEGWQAVETLLSPTLTGAFQFRQGTPSSIKPPPMQVRRAKIVALGSQPTQSFVLVVVLNLEPNNQRLLRVQIYSLNDQSGLPLNLRLVVFDNQGQSFLEAKAEAGDNYLTLQFRGQPGEQFSIMIASEDQRITEKFVM